MLRTVALAAALAQAPAAQAQVSPADKAAADLALARGQLIYAYDQAAWHGTDDLLARIKDPEKRIGGWIVEGPAEAPTLIFIDQDKADPHIVYVAQFRDNRLVSASLLGPGDDRALSPARKAMVAALAKGKEAWFAAKPLYCSKRPPNSVVLPPERAGGPHLVYILSPQTEKGAYPMGGHYRVEIGADGSVGAARSFTNGCLTMDVPESEAGDRTGFLTVTHLLDPVPTEIHVFTALASHAPIAVGTTSNNMLWWVTGSSIEGEKLK